MNDKEWNEWWKVSSELFEQWDQYQPGLVKPVRMTLAQEGMYGNPMGKLPRLAKVYIDSVGNGVGVSEGAVATYCPYCNASYKGGKCKNCGADEFNIKRHLKNGKLY